MQTVCNMHNLLYTHYKLWCSGTDDKEEREGGKEEKQITAAVVAISTTGIHHTEHYTNPSVSSFRDSCGVCSSLWYSSVSAGCCQTIS